PDPDLIVIRPQYAGFRTRRKKCEREHFNPLALAILRTSSTVRSFLASWRNAHFMIPASGSLGVMIFFPSIAVRLIKPKGALPGYLPICLARRIPFAVFIALLLFSPSGTDR